jgi:hypothetical protein
MQCIDIKLINKFLLKLNYRKSEINKMYVPDNLLIQKRRKITIHYFW